jgi:cobalt-precorrin 5A hydrolase
MSTAIIALTEDGCRIARRIAEDLEDADLYMPSRYAVAYSGSYSIESGLKALTAELFRGYDALIFITAVGIAVRCISPYLKDKYNDPAVVVIDDMGKFAISLLAGHIGGANSLTKQVANIIGACPVITTSTDNHGLWAVDLFADEHGLKIENKSDVKTVSAALINGERVAWYTDDPSIEVPFGLYNVPGISDIDKNYSAAVLCTIVAARQMPVPAVWLRQPVVSAGIGCRRGEKSCNIEKAIYEACGMAGISFNAVGRICSIDIKENESGLKECASNIGASLHFYSAEEIKMVEHLFSLSAFVSSKVGVGNVAQSCAYLDSMRGELLLPKTIINGITISLYRRGTL